MRTRKNLPVTFILGCLTLVLILPLHANQGSPSPWAKTMVDQAIAKGYVPSAIQTEYQQNITREEFSELAVNYLTYKAGMTVDRVKKIMELNESEKVFSDTSNPYTLMANKMGIVNGTSAAANGKPATFSPKAGITREEAAVMLQNTAKAASIVIGSYSSNEVYADHYQCSDWAKPAIYFCRGIKNLEGIGANQYAPKRNLSREQAILTFEKLDNSAISEKIHGFKLNSDFWQDTDTDYYANWGKISPIQQFMYKNEGLAFAIQSQDKQELAVYLPKRELTLKLSNELLGDIKADNEGNFYVVTGRAANTPNDESVFITKFDPDGNLIKTTGFRGDLFDETDEKRRTRIPFDAGICSSAFGDGVFMVYYARLMHFGHQGSNAIAVRTSDMSPYYLPSEKRPYVSHSFMQSVIWSDRMKKFVFADQGDAFIKRGSVVTVDGDFHNTFYYYLPPNANNDMITYNKTYAQLANLAELSTGIAVVQASARLLGEGAMAQDRDVAVQIYKPVSGLRDLNANDFVGGVKRSGTSSDDIEDSRGKPEVPITNYGVIWLTDYENTANGAFSPQTIVVDDKLVVLWDRTGTSLDSKNNNEVYYAVLNAQGNIIAEPTLLGDYIMNAYEEPVYHDGKLHWVSSKNGSFFINAVPLKLN